MWVGDGFIEVWFLGTSHHGPCFVYRELTESVKPHVQSVKRELLLLSLPAIAGQVIEPLTQLMETAYIGRLGKEFIFNFRSRFLMVGEAILAAPLLFCLSFFFSKMDVCLDPHCSCATQSI